MGRSVNLKKNANNSSSYFTSFHGDGYLLHHRPPENKSLIPLTIRDIYKRGPKWLKIASCLSLFKNPTTSLIFVFKKPKWPVVVQGGLAVRTQKPCKAALFKKQGISGDRSR
jgi:hypothetical protein